MGYRPGRKLRAPWRDPGQQPVGVPLYSFSTGRQNVVIDSFDRADNASSMGTTETGQTWTPNSGTWGINSNRAYQSVGLAQATTVVETGLANCTIEARVFNVGTPTTTGQPSICFRSVDNNNNFVGNTAFLFVRVAGVFTNLGSWSYGNGARIKVELYGPYIRCFTNNVLQLSIMNTNHQTATKHGLRIQNNTVSRIDDFRVSL